MFLALLEWRLPILIGCRKMMTGGKRNRSAIPVFYYRDEHYKILELYNTIGFAAKKSSKSSRVQICEKRKMFIILTGFSFYSLNPDLISNSMKNYNKSCFLNMKKFC